MNKQDMRDKINGITRWIAYTIYSQCGERTKFSKAYDKLAARVLIDHDFNINDLTGSTKNKANNLFDVLDSSELEMVLASAQSLQKMYNEVAEEIYG